MKISTFNFKKFMMSAAELVDAWRVVPRLVLIGYVFLIISLYNWFKSILTHVVITCNTTLLSYLMSHNTTIAAAKELACHVVGVVGGPTLIQGAFVTTIIGLSTAIFGLYTNTGRRWGNQLLTIKSPTESNPDNDDKSST